MHVYQIYPLICITGYKLLLIHYFILEKHKLAGSC